MEEDQYYIRRKGRVIGQFDYETICQLAKTRKLYRSDELSLDEVAWVTASETEFFLVTPTRIRKLRPTDWKSNNIDEKNKRTVRHKNSLRVRSNTDQKNIKEKSIEIVDEKEWCYTNNNLSFEPIMESESKNKFMNYEITDNTKVWPEGMVGLECAELNPSFSSDPKSGTGDVTDVSCKDENVKSVNETNHVSLIKLSGKMLLGSSPDLCDVCITDDKISDKHMKISSVNNIVQIRDLGSAFGTFINGKRLIADKIYIIYDEDKITIGSCVYQLESNTLRLLNKSKPINLSCTQIYKNVVLTDSNQKICILNKIDIDFKPSQMTVIIGPSGSGKSTLLNTLSGISKPTGGSVKINGINLYKNYEILKNQIAIVHQKDLLFDQLSLYKMLKFTADLRLSYSLTKNEKEIAIQLVIDEVEMSEKCHMKISRYSGGQIKRASLANEILSNPSLLFIDEVTSGLDEAGDKEIMNVLRKFATNGKTVICITHSLANVLNTAHKIIVMAEGGYLAFHGTPEETIRYFDVNNLGEIYGKLKMSSGIEWSNKYLTSGFEEPTQLELPKRFDGKPTQSASSLDRSDSDKRNIFLWHTLVLINRIVTIQVNDRYSLIVAAIQPVFVSFFLVILFGRIGLVGSPELEIQSRIQSSFMVIFLIGISSFWFGCNNASKEIVKERRIFEREKNSGLNPISYLLAKYCVLSLFTLTQSLFLYMLVMKITGLDGSFLRYSFAIGSIGFCGVSLGLLISAISTDTDVASTMVPIAIIPQIVLSGAIKTVQGIAHFVAVFFSPSYWCYGMMCIVFDDAISIKLLKESTMWSQSNYFVSLLIILLYNTFFLYCAGVMLDRQDSKKTILKTFKKCVHKYLYPK